MGLKQRVNDPAHTRFMVSLVVAAVVIVVGIGVLLYRAITLNDQAQARFIRQCMEDHKEYECTYLWRVGNRSGPDVIPIPIPIPMK